MPPGKRKQSNAMLYTLIVFVGLLIAATTVAVIYYVRAEEYRVSADNYRQQKEELANNMQWRDRGKLIGDKERNETYLDKLLNNLDNLVYMIIGGVPEQTSAEAKVMRVSSRTQEIMSRVPAEYLAVENIDPNTTGLLTVIDKYTNYLNDLTEMDRKLREQLQRLQDKFDDSVVANREKELKLIEEKEKYQAHINQIKNDYAKLKEIVNQTAEQQTQTLMAQLEDTRSRAEELRQQLMRREAEMSVVQGRMEKALEKVESIVPKPDNEVAAMKADGNILLVDDQRNIVHINLGSNDKVYRGLTFSVYDQNMPLPKDGKGKAEIEVFDIDENYSMARVVNSTKTNPISVDDQVANLIWDSEEVRNFVVAGDFDLIGDGHTDMLGHEKIANLIRNWGGNVNDEITMRTDFVVLGDAPHIRRRPTFEDMEVDPMAMKKYEESIRRRRQYQEVQEQAGALSIPVFNTERFLYFVGYKKMAQSANGFEF